MATRKSGLGVMFAVGLVSVLTAPEGVAISRPPLTTSAAARVSRAAVVRRSGRIRTIMCRPHLFASENCVSARIGW